jgi:hypothetical protein
MKSRSYFDVFGFVAGAVGVAVGIAFAAARQVAVAAALVGGGLLAVAVAYFLPSRPLRESVPHHEEEFGKWLPLISTTLGFFVAGGAVSADAVLNSDADAFLRQLRSRAEWA